MTSILIFYLIGVLAALSLIVIANIGSDPKTWKLKLMLKYSLYAFASWIFVYIIAVKCIIDN